MIDLKLDSQTHDLVVENFDLQFVTGIDHVVQNLKINLLFFQGEWFLDTLKGVPFYTDIFVKNPDLTVVDNILKATILEVDNVNELLSYDSDYDNSIRKYTVTFQVDTDFGTVTLTEVF